MSALDLEFSLDDIYTRETGPLYMSGIQALVRLPLMQRRLDREIADLEHGGRAAERMVALDHGHLAPGLGQIGPGDEAVVAAADDHHVKLVGRSRHQLAMK